MIERRRHIVYVTRTGEYHVSGVPTLIRLGTPRRLVEADCADRDKLTMLFED